VLFVIGVVISDVHLKLILGLSGNRIINHAVAITPVADHSLAISS
jgi:hypothetical protein